MRILLAWLLLCSIASAELPKLAVYKRDPTMSAEKQMAKMSAQDRQWLTDSLERLSYAADSGDYHRTYNTDRLNAPWLPAKQRIAVELHFSRLWLSQQTAAKVEADKMVKTWTRYADEAEKSLAEVQAKVAKAGGKWPPKKLQQELDRCEMQLKRYRYELDQAAGRSEQAGRKIAYYADRIAELEAERDQLANSK